ncbi:hypothetical protein BDP27DRAFT_1363729 [Rhodocollybia butyracea]|uniref:J domain-containing protein n=1 Tax=Rhodocollybia butyracea TaxID=206335 RepID=A0A9P5PVV7_9AGAR|nr:hypothetical protein BDP27DRAFT_1363729 [Rhodocollybia butyracea]
MGVDYYKILGVDKNADGIAIEKAYNASNICFGHLIQFSQNVKEIVEAFEVLSDKQKRTIYDQFGEEGLKGGPPPGASAGSTGFGGFGAFPSSSTNPFADTERTFTAAPNVGPPGASAGPSGFGEFTGSFNPSNTQQKFDTNPSDGEGPFPGAARPGFGGFTFSDTQQKFDIRVTFGAAGLNGGPPASANAGRSGFGDFSFGSSGGQLFGAMFGNNNNATNGSFFGNGTPTGVPRSNPHSPPQTNSSSVSEMIRPLKVSLQDLYSGAVKHVQFSRRRLDGTTEDKVFDIQIHPGWKSGTKIRYARGGDEQSNGNAQDLVFVVEEKPHEMFKRDGNDLLCTVDVPILEAHDNTRKKTIRMLDGRQVHLLMPLGVKETTVIGEGMPVRKDGKVKSRGDLIVEWNVVLRL